MPRHDHLSAPAARARPAADPSAGPAPVPRAAVRRPQAFTDSREMVALAVQLANAPPGNTPAEAAVTVGWPGLREVATPADLPLLHQAGRQLREVFAHAGARRDREAVHVLNRLLARHRLRPAIAGTGPADRHLHVAAPGATPAAEHVAAAVWALAVFLCEQGIDRFKTCTEPGCGIVFLDETTNRRRRFCSPRCATRAHVRAHRSRRRTVTR
ncbi:CGNR zinc finger domain-containing protein [Micromonospora chalcea]|uniref:CGNR zinc finger domain-containing protein n=1 Tax=Micromonospora chalcea TaxID=1874 RepID=UPI0015F2E283|nr:CGNR zinc finger domain-containing protein [Micromonospora chalcea]